MKRSQLKRGSTQLKRTPFKTRSKPLKRAIGRSGGLKRAIAHPRASKRPLATISKLTKTLDAVFSKYVRLSYANDEEMVKCYTCPKITHWKQIHNGHYVSRSVKILRWDEDNTRPQCFACNVINYGRVIVFRENLVKELGEAHVLSLEKSRHTIFKTPREWLEKKIEEYQSKLQKEYNFNPS